MNIEEITNPAFVRNLSVSECVYLCEEIRKFLLASVSKTGGHLSSNLGVVELTVALHSVFRSPQDKLIFDVGHQCYVHKILTGRAKEFTTLRRYKGLSGFQKREESIHDVWEAGHSSTSLSAALGMAIARDLKKETNEVVAIIGDGAFGGGMALEALNHIGDLHTKVIIILNDNEMSISPNVGAINRLLGRWRLSPFYRHSKHEIKGVLSKNQTGKRVLHGMQRLRDALKNTIIPGAFFKEMGIEYLGPIDGHNIEELQKAMQTAKEQDDPVVIHVRTKKGKGYSFAEADRFGKWHGVAPFDIASGRPLLTLDSVSITYSELVCNTLLRIKRELPTLLVLTPAMMGGSKLEAFFEQYPESSFDCGIAEQHTVTLAASLAQSGLRPFVAVYSSFLQRAYDQMNHDVARMNVPVVIGIDRSGLVGEDGDTHHGVFDVGFLRAMPNVIVAHPCDGEELQHMLYTAFQTNAPFCIRFPRGSTKKTMVDTLSLIPLGSFTIPYASEQPSLIVLTYGEAVGAVASYASAHALPTVVINARFIKPLDDAVLHCYASYPWLMADSDILAGGLSGAVLEWFHDHGYAPSVHRIGIADHFVSQGSISELWEQEGISAAQICQRMEELIHG